MSGRSSRSGILLPLALLLILLLVATLSWRIPGLEGWKRVVQGRSVDITALGSGDTREILQRLQAVHVLPAEPSTNRSARSGEVGGAQTFSLDPIPTERLADVLQIDAKWLQKKVPIAVLLMDEADLDELHANPFARGRDWERPAFFAYLENGELRLTTKVGVRIHGGWSRAEKSLRSYRVYFRNRYGIDHFPAALFPTGGSRSMRTLIIRNDHSVDSSEPPWSFVSPIAYDVARQIGAEAPRTKPVMFYVNGERQGMYQLVERMDRDYLLSHYGHDEFVMVGTEAMILVDGLSNRGQPVSSLDRVRVGPPAVYQEFRDWAENSSGLDLRAIAARVDVDNLSRWLLTVLYCVNQDPFQGSLLLNLRQPDAKWFWRMWDFDGSFLRFGRRQPISTWILEPRKRNRPQDERSWLLNQLIESSPEYRDYLARLFIDTMNHRMTHAFVVSTLDRYRRTAATFEVPSGHFDPIEQLLLGQARYLRRQLLRTLQQRPVRKLRVKAPADRGLVINGYPSGSSFTGLYFGGMSVELAIAEADREAFSHWRIRRQSLEEATLRLDMDSDMRIRAVFRESSNQDEL